MKVSAFLRTYAGLDRSVYVLFIARIINSMGGFVYPFLTLFLTQKLDIPAAAAGRYLMLFALGFIPGSLLGGKLADHLGRKIILLVFQAASALALVPCAFLADSPLIPWLLISSSVFFGAVPPVTAAMVTDLTPPPARRAAFSLLYLGHNMGLALGPLIAGFLFNRYMRWIFLGDAATTLLSLLLILIFVGESIPSDKELSAAALDTANPEKAESGSLAKALLARPFLLAFIVISILISFVYSQFTFSLPLQLTDLFGPSGPPHFGLVMSVNALVVIFGTTVVIHATRRARPVLAVALSSGLYCVGFGMIFWIRSLPLLLFSTFIWTCGEIIGATNSQVYVANHAPISHRGRFNAILPIIRNAGHAAGPALMGLFIQRFSVRRVWPVTALLAGTAALLLLLLANLERRYRIKH
jgi:predicted MFS family arabinose efflux permease